MNSIEFYLPYLFTYQKPDNIGMPNTNPIPHGVAPQQSSAMLRIAVQSYTIIGKHYPERLKYVPAI